MINRLNAEDADFAKQLAQLRAPPPTASKIQHAVTDIIAQVKNDGDRALLALCAKFDDFCPPTANDLYVSESALAAAQTDVSPSLLAALQDAAARIRNYHCRQRPQSWQYTDDDGNMFGERILPVAHAAIYAPGGQAAYPSSVLMGVIPAKIANVDKITLLTPAIGGTVPMATLAAAHIAGADSVLMLGGAQAVAAAAFGTPTIPRADVIVGPGNAFVAEAKRQLCGCIGIDSLAGPSEVLIIADNTANPLWVAADMLAQAEHDIDAQSILISPSREHVEQVAMAIAAQIAKQPRAALIAQSLAARGALIIARDIEDCCRIADDIAAEHVQIMCAKAPEVAARLRHAGGIFIGAHSSVALGDYGAGPNHILPTAQTARFASPLGVGNFVKRTGILQTTAAGARPLAQTAAILAAAEGLFAHAASAQLRADDNDKKSSSDAPKTVL